MEHTIEYDSDWEVYYITVTDEVGNVGTLSHYPKQHKLYWTTFEFTNGKTCSGKTLKANRTRLSQSELDTIKSFKDYVSRRSLE